MAVSLLAHPVVAAALWRAWFETGLQPARRSFELDSVRIGGDSVPLRLDQSPINPFASLSRFTRGDLRPARRILLVPPLSGAFAFILRDMVESLVVDAEVAVLEWTNARFVPSAAGAFLVDDQVAAILAALKRLGPGAHLVAVCQAGPPGLTAAALAAEEPEAAGVGSLSLIAAPIQALAAPSALSQQIGPSSLGMLRSAMVWRETGAGGLRRVFPAEAHFPALTAALAAQRPGEHEFSTLLLESVERRAAKPGFVDFVTSYMDTPAEHAVDNLTRLYLWKRRPLPVERWRRREVALRRLDQTPMAVVEGARDAIAAPGQCRAAYDLCPGAKGAPRLEYLAPNAGHFGLFYGEIWRREVRPFLTDAFAAAEHFRPQAGLEAARFGDAPRIAALAGR